MKYESPIFMDMNELEGSDSSQRGVPIAVFVLITAVSVVAVGFIVTTAVGWNVVVGANYYSE